MFGKMKKMSDLEKKAKLAALGGANKMASDALKGNLDGLKKVTVASDSKKGLKQGLDKAEELIGDEKEPKEHDMSSMMDGESCPESESGDEENSDPNENLEDMSEEELDAKIEELMKLKEKMQAGEE